MYGSAVPEILTWKASATYVTSYVQGLGALGHRAIVSARLDPLTAAMVSAPGAEAWVLGDAGRELCRSRQV